ncbi:conserved membrane protein of unknown function [Thermococcus camini]|uniref:Uncharacterized protein n=1 Tax=Thermococcus camini TaxID=2016373 RepID=A0A7G2D6R5_9EURY|nr:hypothetical protein [Thermococcus camini]CAD5243313.1 conserved membrane protein of unknown function [Thermococcus camini]
MEVAVLTFVFILGVVSVILWGKLGWVGRLLLLTFLAFVLGCSIRCGFGRYFTAFDESYYMSLMGDVYFYRKWPFSGFVLPFLLMGIFHTLRLEPLQLVIAFSLAVFVVYVPVVYWFYRRVGISREVSILSTLVLFLSSYYIWSGLEVRPQQLGLLWGLLVTAYYLGSHREIRDADFVVLPLLFVFMALIHILSFVFFSVLLMLYTVYILLSGDLSDGLWRRNFLLASLSSLAGLLTILWFPPYGRMVGAVIWIVENMRLVSALHLSQGLFKLLAVGGYLLTVAFVWLVVSFLRQRRGSLVRAWGFLVGMVNRFFVPILLLAALAWGVAVYLQFLLNSAVYSAVYRGSLLAFVFFQLGNIFFGFMLVYSLLDRIRSGKLQTLEILAVLWMLIGGAMLAISFIMPKTAGGWGFSNWLVRVLQYFPVFGAPLVARIIHEDLRHLLGELDSFSAKFSGIGLTILLASLIFISVMNVARPSAFYTYDAVITDEILDVSLYHLKNDGIVAWGDASDFRSFVLLNFFRAVSPETKTTTWDSGYPYLVLSSDDFRVYRSWYSTSTLGSLTGRSFFSLRTSGSDSPDREAETRYSVQILRGVYSLSLMNDAECSYLLDSDTPLILIGAGSNDCTALLERSGSLPVSIGPEGVSTPTHSYPLPEAPENWWNVREGYFVIQAVENLQGTPILAIVGTNVDSTIAGVWYFVNEVYPRIRGDYSDVHYIVGLWKEADDDVWPGLKFDSSDGNGFSPGDRITIIEKG